MITLTQGVLIYLAIVNLCLAFKLGWDWYAKNKQHRIINHLWSAFIRVLIFTASANYIFDLFLLLGIIPSFGIALIALGYFWILFDGIFNLINGDKWNHRGISSKLDIILNKAGKWGILLKLAVPVIGVALLFI